MTDESASITTSSNEVLEHELTTLAGQIAAATCRFLLLVAELDGREAWRDHWGCTSMAHWLSWRCSISTITAREHVRVARTLTTCSLLADAFGRGELSYSKVRALARIITPESERDLVDLARVATAAQLERIIRATEVSLADPKKLDDLRDFATSTDELGMGGVRAQLRADEIAIVDTAIAKALPPREGDSAEPPIGRRRADALVRICESYIAHGDAARVPSTRNSAVVRTGGQCEWIGCEQRTYLDGHHVQHWEHGGPTELWTWCTSAGTTITSCTKAGGDSSTTVVAACGASAPTAPRSTTRSRRWRPSR